MDDACNDIINTANATVTSESADKRNLLNHFIMDKPTRLAASWVSIKLFFIHQIKGKMAHPNSTLIKKP